MTPEQRLTHAYVSTHAAEAARELELLPAPDAAALLAPLPPAAIAEVLAQHVPYAGARVLEALPREQGGAVLAGLPTASALGLLRSVAEALRAELLGQLEPQRAAGLRRALAYPPDTAGALADPFVLTVGAAGTAAQALERVRREQHRATYYLYVLESGARLVGVTTLKLLLAAEPERSLDTLCQRPVSALPAEAGLDELLHSPHWRSYHILPVVERSGAFVGALRLRNLHDMEEARRSGGTQRLADALMQLWELYAMAGLGLMTGVASGLDAMADAARGQARGAKRPAAATDAAPTQAPGGGKEAP